MMSTNTHPHGEQLSAFVDGMLDVARTRGVAEHLGVCAVCRRLSNELRQTKALLHALPPPAPDAQFWAGAYRRLRVDDRERAVARRSVWDGLRGPGQRTQRRWAAGLAAAALVAGALVSPLTHSQIVTSGPRPQSVVPAAPQDVSPDVSSLVESHTDSVSRLPLADPDRQKMIAADERQGGDMASAGADAPEAAGYADAAF